MFSLSSIAKRYRWRIFLTQSLVVIESVLDILYPLFIGWAVNDLINQSYQGLILLGLLGVSSLVLGSARRFYDTRIYAGIYSQTATDLVDQGRQQGLSVSKLSARSDLMTELVEFFEQSMPGIILSLIGVVGTLLVIANLHLQVFLGCLVLVVIMLITWWLTGSTQYRYHQNMNHILEQRVDVLGHKNMPGVRAHFIDLMRWNIKLSDLETVNFAVLWLAVVALLLATPVLAISLSPETPQVGTLLSLLIYVFEFSEKVIMLPFFIQQLIRLSEISNRLNSTEAGDELKEKS